MHGINVKKSGGEKIKKKTELIIFTSSNNNLLQCRSVSVGKNCK